MHKTGSLEATRDLLGTVKGDLSKLIAEKCGDDRAVSMRLEGFLEKLYISD
jgi:hypothetical protein